MQIVLLFLTTALLPTTGVWGLGKFDFRISHKSNENNGVTVVDSINCGGIRSVVGGIRRFHCTGRPLLEVILYPWHK